MLNRRSFTALAGAALLPGTAQAQATIPFYASVGPKLMLYGLDVAAAAAAPKTSVTLPANVQYAWPDPQHRFLYVTASSNKPGGHSAQAFRIGADGALTAQGPAVTLAARPINNTVDPTGRFLLIAYNQPSHVTVHRIAADGSIGE